jgi:hypothetical protein
MGKQDVASFAEKYGAISEMLQVCAQNALQGDASHGQKARQRVQYDFQPLYSKGKKP